MLLKDSKEKVTRLLLEGKQLLSEVEMPELAGKAEDMYRTYEKQEKPTVMFYGLYNAGKSTLINALCKEQIAKVGDVPTTATVQTIPWAGYTMIDTPGIQARDDHTTIATAEIDKSDLILFIMDNVDGYERQSVYQAISDILNRGKNLAIVINQKSVNEEEDVDLMVSQLPSMQNISGRVTENLHRHMRIQGDSIKNFLGIFPLNAQTAVDAALLENKADADLLYENSGILSLVNAMNESIRETSRVQMLITPLQNLKKYLQEAVAHYQNPERDGLEAKLSEMLQDLEESRQRTSSRLIQEGMRKIEARFDEIRHRGANGLPFDEIPQQLQADLVALMQEVMERESKLLEVRVDALELPENTPAEAELDFSEVNVGGVITGTLMILKAPIPPPLKILLVVGNVLLNFITKIKTKNEDAASEQEKANAERRAAYYKWCNDLRDSESQTKAAFQDAVDECVTKFFTPKIQALKDQLTQAGETSAIYTDYVCKLNDLMFRTGDTIAEIALTR